VAFGSGGAASAIGTYVGRTEIEVHEVRMAIRALIFDFDGTLLDTESPDMLAW
jgi:hypothetical protein